MKLPKRVFKCVICLYGEFVARIDTTRKTCSSKCSMEYSHISKCNASKIYYAKNKNKIRDRKYLKRNM